jgi:hypothetical protein
MVATKALSTVIDFAKIRSILHKGQSSSFVGIRARDWTWRTRWAAGDTVFCYVIKVHEFRTIITCPYDTQIS